MTETTARIRWHEEYPGTFYGRVGTLESWGFELWQSPGDCGDYALGDWVLTAPFIFADRCLMNGRQTLSDRDPEKLKDDAERLLGEFTASLGAVWPGEPDCSAVTRFEAIDHTRGLASISQDSTRAVVVYGASVKLSFQDDGQTLKVFLTDPAKEAGQ